MRLFSVVLLLCVLAGCATSPPPPAPLLSEAGYRQSAYLSAVFSYCVEQGHITPIEQSDYARAIHPVLAGKRYDGDRLHQMTLAQRGYMTAEVCQKDVPRIIADGKARHQRAVEASRYRVAQTNRFAERLSHLGDHVQPMVICTQVGYQTFCN